LFLELFFIDKKRTIPYHTANNLLYGKNKNELSHILESS